MLLIRLLIFLTIHALLTGCGSGSEKEKVIRSVVDKNDSRYIIFVSKKSFTLQVYNRDAEIIAEYPAGYGKNSDRKPKLYEGDNRTPEGVYFIDGIFSMDAARGTHSYQRLAALNRIYFKASEGFYKFGDDSLDLGDNAYGPRFYSIDYPNEDDKKRYNEAVQKGDVPLRNGKPAGPGFGIAIHGNNDTPGVGQLSSSGCIRLYNSDIVELDSYVEEGTPVIITSKWD